MRKLIKKLGAEGVFDPETVQILVDAFEECWKSVQAEGAAFAKGKDPAAARELLAKHLIETAKSGERDPRKLCEEALLQLARA
jgi:hypothetical protein